MKIFVVFWLFKIAHDDSCHVNETPKKYIKPSQVNIGQTCRKTFSNIQFHHKRIHSILKTISNSVESIQWAKIG